MKNFLRNTKYLWIGGIMGFAQQLMGRIDYYLYHGRDIFSFSAIMGGLSLYAAIILFVIKRKAEPKKQFRDIFLYFFGLNFFYYIYCFIIDLISYLSEHEHKYETAYYFQTINEEKYDFLKWMIIGTAAALWAFSATKLRDKGKTIPYRLMLAPLFAVVILEFAESLNSVRHYIIQEYNKVHDIPNPYGVEYFIPYSAILTSAVILVWCIYYFIFKDRKKKPNT